MSKYLVGFILMFFVFISGCISSEPPGNDDVLETGPDTFCDSDDDCWCQSFDGTKFYNETIPFQCDLEINRCFQCYYR